MMAPEGRKRLVLAGGLLTGVAAALCWVLLCSDPDSIGTRVLGLYRERWFLLNLGLTYLAIWLLVFAVMRVSRRRLVLIAGVHVGLFMAAVAAEGLAYLGLVDYRGASKGQGLHDRTTIPDRRLIQATLPNLRLHGMALPNLVRRLGIDARPVRSSLRTDKFGFRNDGDKSDAKVLCLGDSQLVGGLLPPESLLTVQLEGLLGQPVMNLSEARSAAQEQLIRLDSTGIDVQGKLVVHFISEPTDTQDSAAWRRWLRQSGGGSDWPRSGLVKVCIGMLHRPRRGIAERSSAVFKDSSGKTTKVYFYLDRKAIRDARDELPRLISDLTDWNRKIKARGGRYLIALVPTQIAVLHHGCSWPERSLYANWTPDERKLAIALQEMCAKEQIRFLDLAPALRRSADAGRLPYSWGDTHINEVGHRVAAEAVADWIRDLTVR